MLLREAQKNAFDELLGEGQPKAELEVAVRSIVRLVFATPHCPRRLVLIPRDVSSTAIALSDMCPAVLISASTGTKSKAAAFAYTAALNAAPPSPDLCRLSALFVLPSFTPRALAADRASSVSVDVTSRSV